MTTTALSIPDSDHKVFRYGLYKKVYDMLCLNHTCEEIANTMNLITNDPTLHIEPLDVEHWFSDLPHDIKEDIKNKQWNKLCAAVYNMERQAIRIRRKAMDRLEKLIEKGMGDLSQLTPKELKELGNLVLKPMYVQESAERLSHSNSDRYGSKINVSVKVDLVDRMKQLSHKKKKDKIIDAEYEENDNDI